MSITGQRPDHNRRPTRAFLCGILVAAVLAGAVVIDHFGLVGPGRFLIINSDDAGMYQSVNRATIEAMERGLVSSTSIMVPCEAFEEFAQYARTHPERDYGIHLTLNCEVPRFRWGPVMPRNKVPTLVDQDGMLWADQWQTAKHANIGEVEAELRAQIERALSFGIPISHLDHHKFVLFTRSDFIRLYVRLGIEYRLPIRYGESLPEVDDLDRSVPGLVEAYQTGLEELHRHGLPVLTTFDSVNFLREPSEKREYFLNRLAHLPPGVTEFVIHCAARAEDSKMPRFIERREADARIFQSDEMLQSLRRHGVGLVTWNDFTLMSTRKRPR
jgi:predicted glycoside hydrolase/deacetylase ChbG (UPF0249 family)